MDQNNLYWTIGYRDALAVLCAEARIGGPVEALRKAAEQLLQMDPEHCHAKVVLGQIKTYERDYRRKAWRRKKGHERAQEDHS